jgi:hypothetical protein
LKPRSAQDYIPSLKHSIDSALEELAFFDGLLFRFARKNWLFYTKKIRRYTKDKVQFCRGYFKLFFGLSCPKSTLEDTVKLNKLMNDALKLIKQRYPLLPIMKSSWQVMEDHNKDVHIYGVLKFTHNLYKFKHVR